MRRFAAIVCCLAMLTGCGITDPPARDDRQARPVTGTYNAVDVMFLQMMIPHHRQGMEIARLAAARATRPDVKTLAQAIEATQTTEVGTMTSWLRSTGKPMSANPAAHGDHDHLHTTDPATIDALRPLRGPEFERRFLNLLIGHQHNAIALARFETAGGKHGDTKSFADRVDQSRTAQVQLMLKLLNTKS